MFLFVCWTPYQIFNAVNFVVNDIEDSKGNSDIYIYHDFFGAAQLSENLKKSGVFNQVYDVEVYDKKRKIWYSKLNKIKRLLFPLATVKRYLLADIDVRKRGYEILIIAGNNLFSVNLYNCIKNLRVYFIDDGIASYFGDMRSRDITFLYRIFNKLFHRGPLSYKVEKLYINNKSACQATICDNIIQLPSVYANGKVMKKLKEIFSYTENDLYLNKRYIYLTQPFYETAVGEKARKIEKTIINSVKEEVVVRVHPRQDANEYKEYFTDNISNQWELESGEQITDENVLIGTFSTAQFTPKLLFGKEPRVIFTYKLYGLESNDYEESIERLRSLYNNPLKVIVIENLEELQVILKGLD